MYLTDEQTTILKPHIVTKLSSISEADNDVLADYVLELLKSEGDEETVKRNAKEQLGEFLSGQEGRFIDQLFGFVRTLNTPKPAAVKTVGNGRKRGYEEDEGQGGSRGMKSARRGGRGAYAGEGGWQRQRQDFGGLELDPANPLAALLAMQRALQAQLGMIAGQHGQGRRRRRRCRDFDTKGFCARGAACRFDHGDEFEGFDPAGMPVLNGVGRGTGYSGRGGRGRRRGRSGRRDGVEHGHSEGMTRKMNNTRVVVENIPEEHRKEDDVLGFFEQFGEIKSVQMKAEGRLAIIEYTSHDEAKTAYDSPKVVFDNRFVKVYWYIRERHGYLNGSNDSLANGRADRDGDEDMEQAIMDFDPNEFNKRQEEAQKRYEELKAAREKHDEVQRQIDEQLAESTKLKMELARMMGKTNGPTPESNGVDSASTQTEALKAQLAALEDEARSMGIDPDAPTIPTHARGRGRGRPSRGRGRVYMPWRGSQRNPRATGYGRGAGEGAVKRLDNRPRSLSVVFVEGGDYDEKKDEGLKHFLLLNDQIQAATIERHPERGDGVVVCFGERYRAEMMLGALQAGGMSVPGVGRVEVGWVRNEELSGSREADGGSAGDRSKTASVNGVDGMAEDVEGEDERRREDDYDVADDDSRWMAE